MKVGHIADLHLGYRAYHRSAPDGRNLREVDVEEAAQRVIDGLIEHNVDIALVAGDVFHSSRPPNSAIDAAVGMFTELGAHCPVYIVAGEHDKPRQADTSCILDVLARLPGVTVAVDEIDTYRGADYGVVMVPQNVGTPEEIVGLARAGLENCNANDLLPILCMHGMVFDSRNKRMGELNSVASFVERAVDLEHLLPQQWVYMALGHYHILTGLDGNCYYAGSPEHTSTDLWRGYHARKGGLVYDTEEVSIIELDSHPRRVFQAPPINDNGLLSTSGLMHYLENAIAEAEPLEGSIVRIVAEGLTREAVKGLDQSVLREWKARAVHLSLDLRTGERSRPTLDGVTSSPTTVTDEVLGMLRDREIRREGVTHADLLELGAQLLREADHG